MKTIVLPALLPLLLLCGSTYAQSPSLQPLWSTDTIMQVPESVLYDARSGQLYVANIQGKPSEKDGGGFISKLTPEGKVISMQWVTGLNSPKGMGLHKNRLYVADMNEVAVIDVAGAVIEKRIPVDSAQFLNDITVDEKGNVYVSDSRTKKVHLIRDDKVTTLVHGLKGPNGLLATPSAFYILDAGQMLRLEKNGQLTPLATIAKGTDGIEQVSKKEFVVSCWDGEIYLVNTDNGTAVKMLDTKDRHLNTADIGYDPKKKIVYVPTFYGNTVAAYQLK